MIGDAFSANAVGKTRNLIPSSRAGEGFQGGVEANSDLAPEPERERAAANQTRTRVQGRKEVARLD